MRCYDWCVGFSRSILELSLSKLEAMGPVLTFSPGKIYTLGPDETLQNFEVHLKNREHVKRRQDREAKKP